MKRLVSMMSEGDDKRGRMIWPRVGLNAGRISGYTLRSRISKCAPLLPPTGFGGNQAPAGSGFRELHFSATIFVFRVVVGGVGTLMEVGFLMSKTHKKRAARNLANSLEIPYMQALGAIEDAFVAAYPYRSSVRSSESDLVGIPSVYAYWVEN